MRLFAFATLLPLILLSLAAFWGGAWVLAAVLAITVLTWAMDRLMTPALNPGEEFPTGNTLSTLLALLHFPALALAVWAIAGPADGLVDHGAIERVGLLIGFGLYFGQVAHPNAHELVHRPNRWLRRLGVWVYGSLLIGHHVSAHTLVHHTYVATDMDPSSAAKGQGFWRFAPRWWTGGFQSGLTAENKRYKGKPLRHPYLIYFVIAGLAIAISAALGIAGVAALLLLCGYAQIQMMLSDYVQHYGLRRQTMPNGKPEPVGPAHSWNTPHQYSSAMMLNAPRHSDHHMHPSRPYPGLQLSQDMPRLPYALPTMAVIALIPALWRRVMDPRVTALHEQTR